MSPWCNYFGRLGRAYLHRVLHIPKVSHPSRPINRAGVCELRLHERAAR
jgi:hypothetical protein